MERTLLGGPSRRQEVLAPLVDEQSDEGQLDDHDRPPVCGSRHMANSDGPAGQRQLADDLEAVALVEPPVGGEELVASRYAASPASSTPTRVACSREPPRPKALQRRLHAEEPEGRMRLVRGGGRRGS